ncbi:uncharacterized protein PITG_10150 [Phytophthora infestans T30-4]|uniref:EF-hand domain-containing protein n=1 Tax=Phytophthora infestans (strain T30-4) TaxID=403677 RepID=D0NEF7_PHYIT|nr:uncharacterized protein PITG_10150 [Phytophthora infestans T30-4]EEY56602.1 conserved hypothetical protein [Phytophthora infestans T30-4]|eukprot:XP_002902676.1 conserved hypothetical protein [Phytophthora infestans T30-4]
MTSVREGPVDGAPSARVRDLHRKLLERVLLRSDTQSVKDVFRRYDRERAGVLTLQQFRALLRDHDFLDTDADLLLRHLGTKDQSVSFHAFMGDTQLGTEQNYPPKNINASNSPKKVQQLSQLPEQKKNANRKPKGTVSKAGKQAVELVQDPMEAIRTKLRQRVMGHSKSIREVFMEYDTDGSGFLDYEEFGRFMAKYEFAPEETQTIVDYLDRDRSGTVDYDEFAAGLLFCRPPIQQVLDSIRSRFGETLKKSKQLRDIRAEFGRYDVDGNNCLDHQEFGALLVGLGVKLKAAELRAVLQEIDPDEDERIDFQTITKLLNAQETLPANTKRINKEQQQHKASVKPDDEALVTFRKFDRDGSGKLEYEAFRRLMHGHGVTDDSEIDAMIDQVDVDGSGSISYTEFVRQVDRDGSGQLGYADFRRLMQHYGVKDNAEIDALIDEIDADGSGFISLQAFTHAFDRRVQPSPKKDSEVLANLRISDRDERGERKHDGIPRIMHKSGVSDKDPSGTLADEIDTHDQNLKPTIRLEKKASQAEDEHNTRSRLVALQEQELQFMERVLRRHNSIENGFRHFDREGRNEMDSEQFRDFMGQYGITEEASISMLLKRLDADNSGTIDLHEFLSVFNAQRLARHKGGTTRPAVPGNAARLRELEEKWIRGALTGHDSLRLAFASVDRDQDGEISGDEFRSLMNLHGICDEQDVASLMKKLDVDGNGCIGYEEFESIFHETRNARGARMRDLQIKWMKRVLSCHDSIETAFYQYDEDGNGELDHDEFRHFMKRYGIVKNDDIETLIKRLDTDGSGTISFEAFSIERELAQRMAHQTRDLRLAFRKFDTNGNGLLEYKEFRSVLKSYRLPEMEIRKVIRHLDRDVSGFIDYKEFIAGFGALKESAAAAPVTQKKVEKRVSPGKGKAKTKVHVRRSPSKPQRLKPVSPETLKKTMLERILAIHGTVQGAFREYDLDKEGSLNEAQFGKLVLDCEFSRDEAALLLDIFDQDQSGTVEYQEFLAQLVVKGVQ